MDTQNLDVIVIGCGQMGGAIARGLARSGRVGADALYLVDADAARASTLAAELDARAVEAWPREDRPGRRPVFVLAVKPWIVERALGELELEPDDHVLSVAAGLGLETLRAWAGAASTITRTMPNTPAMVGRGVTGILSETESGAEIARWVFEGVGRVVELAREPDFDALTAISGSGPAYVFTILEALADGGVLMGLGREVARALAVETLAGAAALAAASGEHTAELKDRVASPGGTTIAALRELERHGLRDAIISAVEAAALRSRKMGE